MHAFEKKERFALFFNYWWHDLWNDMLCSQAFSELFSSVRNQNTSFYLAANNQDFYELFHLPLSLKAFAQYQTLNVAVHIVTLQDSPDQWSYMWGSALFSSSKIYKQRIGHHQVHFAFKWLWKSCCKIRESFSSG